MKKITSKKHVAPIIENFQHLCVLEDHKLHIPFDAWGLIEGELLQHRVKFPILEYLAIESTRILSQKQIEDLLAKLAMAKHISCYPFIGKVLQGRLSIDLTRTYEEAIEHIIKGNEWYSCDIISERVFGEGTLRDFEKSYSLLSEMGSHENMWVQRSIGIATHYATKKGLPKAYVEQLLFLMLEHGHKTQLYIKKGIGWPAKTIARFHPDLIYKHEKRIKAQKLSKWFKNKINIGLSMAKQKPISYE